MNLLPNPSDRPHGLLRKSKQEFLKWILTKDCEGLCSTRIVQDSQFFIRGTGCKGASILLSCYCSMSIHGQISIDRNCSVYEDHWTEASWGSLSVCIHECDTNRLGQNAKWYCWSVVGSACRTACFADLEMSSPFTLQDGEWLVGTQI